MSGIHFYMRAICFSFLILLSHSLRGQTDTENWEQRKNLLSTTFPLLVLNSDNREINDATIIINQDTIKKSKLDGYRVPEHYNNEKIDLKVLHKDYDSLVLQSVSFPLFPRIYLFKRNEKYYLANGIQYPLTQYGETVLAINIDNQYLHGDTAIKYIEKVALENDLVLGVNLDDTALRAQHGAIERVGEDCHLDNLFWIQKKDKSDWSLSDSIIIHKLRNDTMFNAVGIPVIGLTILTNEIYIEFYNHLSEKQMTPVLQSLKLYSPIRGFNDYWWKLSLPPEILLYDNLTKELMKIKEIRSASPNGYGFVCDD